MRARIDGQTYEPLCVGFAVLSAASSMTVKPWSGRGQEYASLNPQTGGGGQPSEE
jgi:hypothetical protein